MGRISKREKPEFARIISAKAKDLGLSGHDLAEKAKIPYPTLRDIMAGISPGLEENKAAIAKALGCSIGDIYRDQLAVPPPANDKKNDQGNEPREQNGEKKLDYQVLASEIAKQVVAELKSSIIPPELTSTLETVSQLGVGVALFVETGDTSLLPGPIAKRLRERLDDKHHVPRKPVSKK